MASASITAAAAVFTHVYMPAELKVGALNLIAAIPKPINRQLADPITGMLRQEWDVYLTRLVDAVNTINQNTSQS